MKKPTVHRVKVSDESEVVANLKFKLNTKDLQYISLQDEYNELKEAHQVLYNDYCEQEKIIAGLEKVIQEYENDYNPTGAVATNSGVTSGW